MKLLAFIVFSALPIMLSYMLLIRRDMGTGLITQKEGSADASPRFNSPMALAWRQHKGSIRIWAIGMAYLGGIMGVGTPNISEAISSTFAQMNTSWAPAMAKLGNQEGFIAVLIYILGLMAGLSVFAITALQRLRAEVFKSTLRDLVVRAGSFFFLLSENTQKNYTPFFRHILPSK